MKTEFTPIAMRCTKEQFKAIKPKLKNIEISYIHQNDAEEPYVYLTNIYSNDTNNIKIGFNSRLWNEQSNLKSQETWNEETFLKACGIETEPTYTVTESFIKEAYDSACDTWKDRIKKEFPDVFKSDLEVGKWYKNNRWNDLIFIYQINEKDEVKYYGFNDCEFVDERNSDIYYGYAKDSQDWTLATDKEVEEALIKEATRRGFKEGVSFFSCSKKMTNKTLRNTSGKLDFEHLFSDNCVYIDGFTIFEDGVWAEIISEPIQITLEQIADKFGVNVEQLKIKK